MIDYGNDPPKSESSPFEFMMNAKLWPKVNQYLNMGKDQFGHSVIFYLTGCSAETVTEFFAQANKDALNFACLQDPHSLLWVADAKKDGRKDEQEKIELFYQLLQNLSSAAIVKAIPLTIRGGCSL